MGREVKRVPLDFDWPQDKVWYGYLMSDRLRARDCAACDGRGVTAAHHRLDQCVSLILMLDDDLNDQRRGRQMHPYFASCGYGPRPSADIGEVARGLCGRDGRDWGHDALDRWAATNAVIRAAGLPDTWGHCPDCGGHGSIEAYPGQRAEAEAWEPTEPPAGDGWQLWETVTEGSPISPVFPTPEALAEWILSPACSKWSMPKDYETALRFVIAGWAPSMVAGASGVISGAEWVGRQS